MPGKFEYSHLVIIGDACSIYIANKCIYSFFFALEQFIRPFDDLSTDEKTFLERRSVCCKDICTCVDPDSQVACLIDPCEVTDPPCDEATKCVPNFCGGCFTDWFTNSGTPACL